jgi:DMSO/TMAO reductase YedYZ molybdopterin-dependent catalytic subunit
MDIRDTLPEHAPADDEAQQADQLGSLRIGGLVERQQTLQTADLVATPRGRLVERFVCEEGWAVDGLAWEGIPLREIVAACKPLPEARYAQVRAGPYWVSIPFADLDKALLCDRLNGEPLSREHGAPWRLVLSGGACFTSVKWVSALDIAAEPGAATAERIARERLVPNAAE